MPYYYFYGFDPAYLLLIVVSTILGMATQGYIRSTYRKWSNVPASSGMTGAQVARRMLDEGGASSVGITEIGGTLTDNFDPTSSISRRRTSPRALSPRSPLPATRQDTPARRPRDMCP